MPKDKTEETPAGAGHNKPPFDLHRDDFFAFYRRFHDLEAQGKAVNARKSKLMAELKSRGVKGADWKAWMRLQGLDPTERARFDATRRAFDEFLGMEPGEQFAMDLDGGDDVSDEEREAQLVARAERTGFDEGLKGQMDEWDNPHAENTPTGQAWIKGYRDGQQAAVRRIGALDAALEGDRDMSDRDFSDDDFEDDDDEEGDDAEDLVAP